MYFEKVDMCEFLNLSKKEILDVKEKAVDTFLPQGMSFMRSPSTHMNIFETEK